MQVQHCHNICNMYIGKEVIFLLGKKLRKGSNRRLQLQILKIKTEISSKPQTLLTQRSREVLPPSPCLGVPVCVCSSCQVFPSWHAHLQSYGTRFNCLCGLSEEMDHKNQSSMQWIEKGSVPQDILCNSMQLQRGDLPGVFSSKCSLEQAAL